MSEAITFEKVWQMFQETDRKFQETDRIIKENAAQQKETDRKFQETDRIIKENAAQQKETDRKFQETSRQIKELGRRFGDLGNRLGEFVEGMVKPAAVRLFQQRGIAVHEVHSRTSVTRDNESLEIDLLVVNDTEFVAIECKSRLTSESVEAHLARLAKVKRMLPKYAGMKLYGAVAGIVVDGDARELAEAKGLFVISQSGDSVEIVNPPNFVPKEF
jgi:hypothetical protein